MIAVLCTSAQRAVGWSNSMIDVRQLDDGDPGVYQVELRDGAGSGRHRVTAGPVRCVTGFWVISIRLERCVEAAFRFLLAREPKEAILRDFDVAVISRYFPEFEAQWPRYLADPTL
ncbi:MAG: hypothetical protein MZV49_22785 [Rhodopseudomonas palustris]|nr:hypothetical protein [Rhodopseudomonas palustris]